MYHYIRRQSSSMQTASLKAYHAWFELKSMRVPRQLACGGLARLRELSGFWASEMTFFRSARNENLRVEGPPMVGWKMTLFARMRSSLLQWSFCSPCSRSAAVRVPTNKVSEPHIYIWSHITKTTGCTSVHRATAVLLCTNGLHGTHFQQGSLYP